MQRVSSGSRARRRAGAGGRSVGSSRRRGVVRWPSAEAFLYGGGAGPAGPAGVAAPGARAGGELDPGLRRGPAPGEPGQLPAARLHALAFGQLAGQRCGYAGGRFAMDINAIWAPKRSRPSARSSARCRAGARPHGSRHRESAAGRSRRGEAPGAISRWCCHRRRWSAGSGLVWPLSRREAAYWNRVRGGPAKDTLRFLALALDSAGHPIPVVNTDPATGLFLDPGEYGAPADLAPVVRGYRRVSSSPDWARWSPTTPSPPRRSGGASSRTATIRRAWSGAGR